MFCGFCGNKVDSSEYHFCTSCGKPLKDQEASVLDNQDVEDEYLVSPESAPPEVPSIADECISPKEEPEEKHLSSYELPPSEVLPDTYESIHSDIKPEGESIQENQNIQNIENNVPQSKYLSVTWWKESPWPWQARSLDGQTLLGSYETEVKAAEVVAKFHGIDRMDLMMAAVASEKEEELRHKIRKKTIDEKWENRVTKNPEIPKPESAVNDHTSSPAQSRIKEHIEPPTVRESVETNTLHADSKTKQTESSNSTSTVILWIVVIAFFGTVMLSTSEGKQRLWNGVEGAIFGTIGMGLFWLLGAIINSITGKEIRTSTLYLVAAGAGFAGRHALIAMLAGQP